ncbi:MAG TPA: hypothetical protein VF384_10985 [Planctomycetota bacterium]
MKHIPTIAGALLGLLFVFAGLVVLFDQVPPQEPPPPDSAKAHFFAAFGATGYLKFVKVLEVLGGLLVAIPRTRGLGLLVLGPIIVNILAFWIFVDGTGLAALSDPMLAGVCVLALYLLYVERAAFLGLLRRATSAAETDPPRAVAAP